MLTHYSADDDRRHTLTFRVDGFVNAEIVRSTCADAYAELFRQADNWNVYAASNCNQARRGGLHAKVRRPGEPPVGACIGMWSIRRTDERFEPIDGAR